MKSMPVLWGPIVMGCARPPQLHAAAAWGCTMSAQPVLWKKESLQVGAAKAAETAWLAEQLEVRRGGTGML